MAAPEPVFFLEGGGPEQSISQGGGRSSTITYMPVFFLRGGGQSITITYIHCLEESELRHYYFFFLRVFFWGGRSINITDINCLEERDGEERGVGCGTTTSFFFEGTATLPPSTPRKKNTRRSKKNNRKKQEKQRCPNHLLQRRTVQDYSQKSGAQKKTSYFWPRVVGSGRAIFQEGGLERKSAKANDNVGGIECEKTTEKTTSAETPNASGGRRCALPPTPLQLFYI